MTTERHFSAELDIAKQLASCASEIALQYFHRGVPAHTKPDGTPVTVADREIEHTLRDALTQLRPDDAVLGEELGARGDSTRHWLLDPIDGTSNFIAEIPNGERTSRSKSRTASSSEYHSTSAGSRLVGLSRRRRLSLRYRFRLKRPVACLDASGAEGESSHGVWTNAVGPVVERLRRRASWVEPDLDALLRLAEGKLEAVIDPSGKAWDHAPAVILVEEAGGTFSDSLGGHRVDLGEGRFSNGFIHRELEALLAI